METGDPTDMKDFLDAAINATMQVAQSTLARQFNRHLTQFIAKLLKVYRNLPDSRAVKLVSQIQLQTKLLDQLIASDATLIIRQFHALTAPYYDSVSSDDAGVTRKMFIEEIAPKIPIIQSLELGEVWSATPEQTKQSIWRYLQKLRVLAVQFNESEDKDKLGGQAMEMLKQPQFHAMMESMLNIGMGTADTEEEISPTEELD